MWLNHYHRGVAIDLLRMRNELRQKTKETESLEREIDALGQQVATLRENAALGGAHESTLHSLLDRLHQDLD